MPPTVTTRSLQWAFFNGTHSLITITHTIEGILHSRQNSQDDSDDRGFRGPPATNNNETITTHPSGRPRHGSPIPGLNRSLFIVVIVASVVVLILAIFTTICCWQRRKRNRLAAQNMRQIEDMELVRLGDTRRFGDTPRPDSTTLPMQGALVAERASLPTIEGSVGSPLDLVLNRFNTGSGSSGSHRRLGSQDSERDRIIWDSDVGMAVSSTTPPTISTSNSHKISRSRSTSGPVSPPIAVLRSPTINSFTSSPSRMSPTKSASRSSVLSTKIRKKIRPVSELNISKTVPSSPMSTFAGFGRASAGSMSNWTSWWETSSDEDEGEIPATRKKKRRK